MTSRLVSEREFAWDRRTRAKRTPAWKPWKGPAENVAWMGWTREQFAGASVDDGPG